jgi:hypothetical protein
LVSRSRADSVFVSVGAARFRFTRSLLLVVVPCWTGSDLFLSSRREQVRTDGEEPELPSSFSAVVPFASHFPFALFASRKPARASAQSGRKSSPFLLRGSRLVPLLSLGANLHLCRSVDRAVFPSPACPVSDLPPAWCCVFTAAVFSC